jgi:hypothetical protein
VSDNDSLDEFAKALFEAARREQPSAEIRSRAARFPPLVVRNVVRWRRPVFAALGLAAALVLASVVALRSRHEPLLSMSAERTPRRGAVSNQHPSQSADEAPPTEPARVEPSKKPVHPVIAKPPEAPQPASLPDEISALDRARTALGAADPAKALRILDDYDHVLHGTRLTAEATLLRIDALARQGKKAQASELARRFIDANPSNALTDRARAFILGGSTMKSSGVDSGGLP